MFNNEGIKKYEESGLASDDVEDLRCIVVVRQQQASWLNRIPDGSDAGALELLVVLVPELSPPRLGIEPEGRLFGGEAVDPAVGPGTEAVLLLLLEVLP